MTAQYDLFGGTIQPESGPYDGMSRTQKATAKRKAREAFIIAHGHHPLNGKLLLDGDETCGTCSHRVMKGGHAKDYPKCELGPVTNGPGTDCLASWPACEDWGSRDA